MADYRENERSNYARDDLSSNQHSNISSEPALSSMSASGLGTTYSLGSGASPDEQPYISESLRTDSALDDGQYGSLPKSAFSPPDAQAYANDFANDDPDRLGPSPELIRRGDDYGAEDDESRTMALRDALEAQPDLDNYVEDVVQPGFDEAILRALCDMDVSRGLFLYRSSRYLIPIFL